MFEKITLTCGLLVALMALALATAGVICSDGYTWLKVLSCGMAALTGAAYCAIFATVIKEGDYD